MNVPLVAVLVGASASVTLRQLAGVNSPDLLLVINCREAESSRLATIARSVGRTVVVDLDDDAGTVAALVTHGVSDITTFVDAYCPVVDRLRHTLFGAPRRSDRWRKDEQRRLLAAAGLGGPATVALQESRDLRTAAARLGLPMVVKPLIGVGSRDTWFIRTDEDIELAAAAALEWVDLIAEQYIVGDPSARRPGRADYASVELFAGAGGRLAAVSDRLPLAAPFRETGIVGPSNIAPAMQADLMDLGWVAHQAVGGGAGGFHVEMKLGPAGPSIIEINGRLGGHVRTLFELAAGVDAAAITLAAVAGQPLPDTISWRQCATGLVYQAPQSARRVVAAPTRRDVATLPGVARLDSWCGPGTALDWRVGTAGAVLGLWITATDEQTLAHRVANIARFLADAYVFHDASGRAVKDLDWLAAVTPDRTVSR
jgi:hypothetical protein